MDSRTENLKRRIREWGADIVGIGDLTQEEEREALSGEFKHFTRAISIAIHCHTSGNSRPSQSAIDDHERMGKYIEKNEDVTKKLNLILDKTSKHIKKQGYKCLALPPVRNTDDRRFVSALFNLFPHRMAATSSGLGWIGKNGMLINGEYGPNLVWATILTDAGLAPTAPSLDSQCADCRLCQTACPVGAIPGINWRRADGNRELIDTKTCEAFMRGNAERYGRPVCGICFMACPLGAKVTR